MGESIISDFSVATHTILDIKRSQRMRRTRASHWSRKLVSETRLTVDDLIWPVFVIEGIGIRQPIASMPGVFRLSADQALIEVEKAAKLGIPAIALFPFIHNEQKDNTGSYILATENPLNSAIQLITKEVPEIGVITDVALDPFTSHGHDGILQNGVVLNDATVHLLAQAAVIQAQAGASVIAPSDMMDRRVGAIRDALDANGFHDIPIMSYAAKFSSDFYGPYRDAIGTHDLLRGNKKTYYLDPANAEEAIREVQQDLDEGADMIIIKPGLPYLDVIYRVKNKFRVPTFAYQVSGEYSMIKAAGEAGWLNEKSAVLESLLSFKRAGCDGIFTYFAQDIAHFFKE